MMGLVHKAACGRGFSKIRSILLSGQPSGQYHSVMTNTELLSRSVLGLVEVYKNLPHGTTACATISAFQASLQRLVLDRAQDGERNWKMLLSPRKRSE